MGLGKTIQSIAFLAALRCIAPIAALLFGFSSSGSLQRKYTAKPSSLFALPAALRCTAPAAGLVAVQTLQSTAQRENFCCWPLFFSASLLLLKKSAVLAVGQKRHHAAVCIISSSPMTTMQLNMPVILTRQVSKLNLVSRPVLQFTQLQ